MAGIDLQGAEKIAASGGGATGAGFEDTEIVPAIGVVGLQVKRLALLINGLRKLAAGAKELGEQGMHFGVAGVALSGFAQLLQRIVGAAGLGQGHGEALSCLQITGLLLDGFLQERDGLLGLAGFDGGFAELGERGDVGGIELEGALEFRLGGGGVVFTRERDAEAAVDIRIVGAMLEHGAELLIRIREVAALEIQLREVEARIAGGAGGDGLSKGAGGCLGIAAVLQGGAQAVERAAVVGVNAEHPAIVGDGFGVVAEAGESGSEVVEGNVVGGHFGEAMFHPCFFEEQARVRTAGRHVDGEDLNPEVGHFVDGAIAVADADGRAVGIVNVVCGVVVDVAHVQDRSAGKKDGAAVAIDGLAIDIPVGNADEPLLLSPGEIGPAFENVSEIMRVRIDAEGVDIDGQAEGILDDENAIVGGDVELLVGIELKQHGVLRGGLRGKVEADASGHDLGLSTGLEVHVEDEVVAGIEAPGHGRRFLEDGCVGLPEEEVAVGIEDIAGVDFEFHAAEAVLPVGGMRSAPGAGAIDEDIRVMHDLRDAGENLYGADVVGLGEGIGKDEVVEDVGAGGLEGEGAGNGEDEIGLACLPVRVIVGRGRSFRGIALGHAGGDPAADEGDVFLADAAVVDEVAIARLGQPGRHEARLRDLHHLGTATARVLIAEEAEGSAAAGVMAGAAVLIDDGGDLAAPCDGCLGGTGGAMRERQAEKGTAGERQRDEPQSFHGSLRGTMEQPTVGPPGGGTR